MSSEGFQPGGVCRSAQKLVRQGLRKLRQHVTLCVGRRPRTRLSPRFFSLL